MRWRAALQINIHIDRGLDMCWNSLVNLFLSDIMHAWNNEKQIRKRKSQKILGRKTNSIFSGKNRRRWQRDMKSYNVHLTLL